MDCWELQFMYPNDKIENLSTWQPSDEWKEVISRINYDIKIGKDNLSVPIVELDGKTVRDSIDDYFKSFIGSSTTHKSQDPDHSWQTYIHSPLIPKKANTFIAHALKSVGTPMYVAFDSMNDTSEDVSRAVTALSEHVFENNGYEREANKGVISITYSPYYVMETGYADGSFYTKSIDPKHFYFANLYEEDMQKQRFVAKEELIDYYDAEMIYGEVDTWKHVVTGQRCYWDAETGNMRYSTSNDRNLVAITRYISKPSVRYPKGIEVTLINGIPVTKISGVKRKSKKRPYPYQVLRYENTGTGFIGSRPFSQILAQKEEMLSKMQSIMFDLAQQSAYPASVTYGIENPTARMFAPGTIIPTDTPDAGAKPLVNGQSMAGVQAMIQYIERESGEQSSDALQAGNAVTGTTATESVIANENFKKQLGIFLENMKVFIKGVGLLVMDDIFQHMLVRDVSEISGNSENSKALLLSNRNGGVKGKLLISGKKYSDEEAELKELEMLADAEEKGYESLMVINPDIVKTFEYGCYVLPVEITNDTKAYSEAKALDIYRQFSSNPTVDLRVLTEETLKELVPKRAEKLMSQQTAMNAVQEESAQAQGMQLPELSQVTSQAGMPQTL